MSGWYNWNTWHAGGLPRPLIGAWDFAQPPGTQTIPGLYASTAPALGNGSDPANADASDIAFDGRKGTLGGKYAITAALSGVDMGADWTLLLVGNFSGNNSALWSWGKNTGSGHYQLLEYSGVANGDVKFRSVAAGGTSTEFTGRLQCLVGAVTCLIIKSSAGAITLKRMDSGAVATPGINNGPVAATLRICAGARAQDVVDAAANGGELHFAALAARAWTDAEDAQAYGWIKRALSNPPHDVVWPEPIATWGFDDGPLSTYTIAAPLFATYRIPGTANIITSLIHDTPTTNMSWAQLLELQNAGWEILNHTANHVDLTALTEAQVRSEFADAQAEFAAHGLTVKNAVYPGGAYNATVLSVAAEIFRSARTVYNPNGIIPYEIRATPYQIQAFGTDNIKTNIADLKAAVDAAAANRRWIQFYGHAIDETFLPAMTELIEYVNSKGFRWVTHDLGCDIFKIAPR